MDGHEVWRDGDTPLVFLMVSDADGVTPMPGLSPLPTVQVGPNGGALVAAGAVAEIGGGLYRVAQSGTYSSSTPYGPMALVATATGARGVGLYPVVGARKDALAANSLDTVVVESGLNARQALSVITAALAGVTTGAGTGTTTIKNPAGTATRVTATTPGNGNRTSVVLTPSA